MAENFLLITNIIVLICLMYLFGSSHLTKGYYRTKLEQQKLESIKEQKRLLDSNDKILKNNSEILEHDEKVISQMKKLVDLIEDEGYKVLINENTDEIILENNNFDSCNNCKFSQLDTNSFPCNQCKHNYIDKYKEKV